MIRCFSFWTRCARVFFLDATDKPDACWGWVFPTACMASEESGFPQQKKQSLASSNGGKLVVYRWWFEKKHQQKHLEVSTNHWCKKLLTTQKLVLCNCLNFNPLRLRQVLARAAEIQVPDSEEILWWFYGRFFVVDWLVDWYKMRVLNHSDLQWCNFCCFILTCENIIYPQTIGFCESGGFASQQRALLGSHASCGGLCGGEGFCSRVSGIRDLPVVGCSLGCWWPALVFFVWLVRSDQWSFN